MLLAVAAIAPSQALASYGWPVKPFDRQHPVRGNFGDPRTIFHAPPTTRGLMSGSGSFQFHPGVDIAAPDGTPVFAVADGTVACVTKDWVGVGSPDGRAFQYWHVTPTVAVGDRVVAQQTIVGHILRGAGHVHLTELDGTGPVNPLAAGHLAPYADHTRPTVASISFRQSETGPAAFANYVRGSVIMIADGYDDPALPVPGQWQGMPIAPALVTWHLANWNGRIAIPEQVAADFRQTVPEPARFWAVYARGTYQNMAVFGSHFSWLQRGSYLFKLTPTPLDTRKLADGVYDLTVTVVDIRGNRSSLTKRFLVHNRAGWIGS